MASTQVDILGNSLKSQTGTGKYVGDTSPTFTTKITTPTAEFTGAANKALNVVANTGSAYTLDPANGTGFSLTMNSATPTITLASAPASTVIQALVVDLIQDGTGGRAPTFANVTWAAGVAPTIKQAIGDITTLTFVAQNGVWYGYASQVLNSPVTSTLASGSATSLTTATDKTITSISLPAGTWIIFGNVGVIAASGTLVTRIRGSISTVTNTHATSPNGGSYAESNMAYAASTTNVLPVGSSVVSPGSTTTYYLIGSATFTVSTATGYGSITAVQIA